MFVNYSSRRVADSCFWIILAMVLASLGRRDHRDHGTWDLGKWDLGTWDLGTWDIGKSIGYIDSLNCIISIYIYIYIYIYSFSSRFFLRWRFYPLRTIKDGAEWKHYIWSNYNDAVKNDPEIVFLKNCVNVILKTLSLRIRCFISLFQDRFLIIFENEWRHCFSFLK